MEALQHNLDQFPQSLVNLTGAINRRIEQISVIEVRLSCLENRHTAPTSTLVAPATVADPLSVSKLLDAVRDLQVFEGNSIHYVSWVHNVESILKDYEIVRNKPIYRAILKHVRQKIRGDADNALISYNIFDEEWIEIKKCLALHYAGKRDIQSLENQLVNMRQGRDSIGNFYGRVNRQLSLIINKIKTDDHTEEGKNVLVENYRYRALDVFIRGLQQNVSHLVKVQRSKNLPEAYAACLELQKMDYRKSMSYEEMGNFNKKRQYRPDYFQQTGGRQVNSLTYDQQTQSNPLIQAQQKQGIPQNLIMNSNPIHNNSIPPPRPTTQKPPVPMDIDPSIQSKRINYMNRPNPTVRPSNLSSNIPRKYQRVFNMEPASSLTPLIAPEQEEIEVQELVSEEEYLSLVEEECSEINFMTGASPVSPT